MAEMEALRLERDWQENPRSARHQREVGAGYFDKITKLNTRSEELSAVHGSTEEEQFEEAV